MTVAEFEAAEASQFQGALLALWWDRHGVWDRAHEVAQEIDTPEGAWVHAYLHRKEGDEGNARYWYRRAGRPVAAGASSEEWEGMVTELLRGPGLR